jgi:glyoxylase-like metal-dependent hydrolase (beta-lactamase superfamily II)
MIIEKITVSPLLENCYIVGDAVTKEGIIIDPGDEAERILRKVAALGLRIDKVVNTHAHVDHVCAVQTVKEALSAKFYLHPAESMHLPRLLENAAMFGISNARVPVVDVALNDGDVITFGSYGLKVVTTPGHTPGHCVLISDTDVFCGDLIFAGSIGRTDFPGGDYPTILASLESAILTLPGETRLHPGHGPSTTVAVEREYNPFLRGLSPRPSSDV